MSFCLPKEKEKKNNKEVNSVITMYTRTQCVVKNQGFKFTLKLNLHAFIYFFKNVHISVSRKIGDFYGLFCFQQ